MDFYQYLAVFGGLLVILSTLPQVFKTLKTKEVKDLSLGMFSLLAIAQAIWLFYGIHLKDFPLIVTNGGSILVVGTNIFLIFRYKNA